jgi:hypothetical protein
VIWHPLVWAFWAAAVSGSLLYAVAALRAIDVVANWAPRQADPNQLRRERQAETAALLGRGSMGSLAAAVVMGLTGIALVWHRIIPGAMCGTGVLQTMGIAGHRAMLFWSVAIILLYAWRVMDGLDHHHPQGLLIPAGARLFITAAPFIILALGHSWQGLMRIDGAPPVSCCAAVYDQVLSNASTSPIMAGFRSVSLWISLTGSAVLPVAAVVAATRIKRRLAGATIAATATGWSVLSTVCVKHVWSAYYYEVLSHPCPWCLFLPDYHGIGFLIFACLAAVALEGVAFWVADHIVQRYTALAAPAKRRRQKAAWRIMAGVVAFSLLTLGPALTWRLRTGVWMDGSF